MNAIRTNYLWLWIVLITMLALLVFATPAGSVDTGDGHMLVPGTLVMTF